MMIASAWLLSAAAPTVWLFDSLTRVAPTDPAGTQTQMTIYAARGEYQSFQIGVRAPSGGLSNVSVTVSKLAGPGTAAIPSTNLTLFREMYVSIPTGKTSEAFSGGNPCTECPLGAGTYADGLIPFVDPDTGLPPTGVATMGAVPFALAAGQNQPIWVDVLVPRSATSGTYTGTLTVTSDQGQAQVALTLTVWRFALPLQPSLNSAFLVNDMAHKPSTDVELMRNRFMPDSTKDTAEAAALTSKFGLGAYGIGWFSGASYGQCSTNQASPTIAQAQTAAAPFQALNLMVYDYSFDEVDGCTNLFPTIIQWAQNLHQAGVDQLITMAPTQALFDDGLGTGRSAVDIWAMEPDKYVSIQSTNPPLATAALARGDKVWAYQTLIQDTYSPKWLIDFAPIGMRTMAGFLSQSLGFSGLLYWSVDSWLSGATAASWSNIFFTEDGNTYPGEGILVYPGEPVGMPGKVVPSMRLKQLRDGEQDYEYVQLLKGLGVGPSALQVASSVAADYKTWSQTPATLQAARLTLGQQLDSLIGGHAQVSINSDTSSVSFSSMPGTSASPAVANLNLSTSDNSSMNFTVTPHTATGSWLSVTALGGVTPATIGISVNTTGLARGTYTGSIVIAASGASNTPLTVAVTVRVNPTLFRVPVRRL